MQLTTHTDYSLRLLIYLAVKQDEKATIQDAAARFDISANHLAKVVQTLVQLNYVVSHRGRGGGLRLGLPTESINIGKLVRQTENLQLLPCFGNKTACAIDSACTLKGVLARAQQAFLKVLDDYTLSDLIGAHQQQLKQLLNVA
ncbi:Nitrite-sensitive transcriptional repressor NsrR [Methylophaga frappieri]|uniref:Nitrite-sensitive transcriptional repressor NsrR n=1 Tax=Methylophaga frappieri (strain ATCC BAA-2434 / DSM 25690 / JAM7) TaxID=754477 RepID=I1YJW4_METFJ|nr:Rrf2 family transcriptional regulator [Methylophaga frappieri]AFJ03207.1 Nitrite-sensitive transcriptional repressor NsrR [Methylophaga frappieri]